MTTARVWPPPRWEQRFRAGRVLLPRWAADNPDRAVVVMTDGGRLQAHSWTPSSGRALPATARTQGTSLAEIDPAGNWVWWFDDTDGNEFGVWRRQPFGATPGRRVETPIDLPAAYPRGLLIGRDGTAVVGRGDSRYGTQIHSVPVGRSSYGTDGPTLIYRHESWAAARAMSRDGRLIAVEHSEHGDSRHPAIRVYRRDGWPVAELDDGADRGLWALGFAPAAGDQRLLVRHERGNTPKLLIWDVDKLIQRPVDIGVEGEIGDASWYPDGRHVLVAVDHHARTRLFRVDLFSGSVVGVGPMEGTAEDAVARPDGDAWVLHSSSARAPAVLSARSGRELLTPPGAGAPASVAVRDVWVDGPGGRIHALLRLPTAGAAPYPVVVKVHGGPTLHDSDSFSPAAAAWVDHGWAVLEVNYRGSTGYGVDWRDALEAKVGFTELADVAAVHDHLLAEGTVDPDRSVLVGRSWGGYLTLLGLGTQPERWAAGVAAVPVADYVAAYEDEMGSLQDFDRALFGGSPDEVPEAYRESSPLTYVDAVRVPVLISAGENDPRCPYRQILNYVEALRHGGGTVETHVYDAGHASQVDDERVTQMRLELDFVRRHVGTPAG
ncbi:prolyl oligopeptidase family serine peptidase [Pseudactinotalea sp.]|uniref:S9 family peptidase n=1 Tax=Pseudactinotalea sp. TaxID=1926260 RepID=UPI003B3A7CBC